MRLLIVGAGAVGGFFGGRLAKAGCDVTFLARGETLTALRQRGLAVKSFEGDFQLAVRAVGDPKEAGEIDLIVLAVKTYDLPSLLPALKPLVERGSLLLTLQNGIDAERMALDFFGRECVVAGVVFITARRRAPGVIEHFRRGILTIGELDGAISRRAKAIAGLFSGAGVEARLVPDMIRVKWEKLCWNAPFNPLSVILRRPISAVLESPDLTRVARAAIAEVAAVAKANGIVLSEKIASETIDVSWDLKEYYTSMYEDFVAGRPTENESLCGAVVREGEKAGIATPINEILYVLVKVLEISR